VSPEGKQLVAALGEQHFAVCSVEKSEGGGGGGGEPKKKIKKKEKKK